MEVAPDGEVRQVANLEAGITVRLTTGRKSPPWRHVWPLPI